MKMSWNLKTKILVSILALVLIPTMLLAGLGTVNLWTLSQNNIKDSSSSLELEAKDNLLRLVEAQALAIDEVFDKVRDDVLLLAQYVSDVYEGRINVTTLPSYYWDYKAEELRGNPVPGLHRDTGMYDRWISYEVSSWYLPPPVLGDNPFYDLPNDLESIVNLTSNLEVPLKMIKQGNPDFGWVYFADQRTGLLRSIPYDNLQFYGPDPGDYDPLQVENEFKNASYDPRKEDWYRNPSLSDDVVVTGPYFDETGLGLMITFGKAVRWEENNSLIGVASMDLTMGKLQSSVINITVAQTGHAFLLDSRGNAMAHPNLGDDSGPTSIFALEGLEDETEIRAFEKAIQEGLQDKSSGVEELVFNGHRVLYAHAFIPTTNFTIGIVVPEEEIIAPALILQSETTTAVLGQMIVLLFVLVIALVFIVSVVTRQTNRIVSPIKDLTEVCDLLAQGDLHVEPEDISGGGKEIYAIHERFIGLITALRFGNDDYYLGDLHRAFQNYQAALELFTNLNNQRGMGICHNNLGNIYKAWGDVKKAKSHYETAIDIARTLNDKLALARRLNNLALLYLDLNDPETAVKMLEEAKEYDYELDNVFGLSTRLANLGLAYFHLGRLNLAMDHFNEALQIAEERKDQRSIAYVNYYLGNFYLKRGQLSEAADAFGSALNHARLIDDMRLQLKIARQLVVTYHRMNSPSDVRAAERLVAHLEEALEPKKVILFVIDYSGSMSGSRIKAAVNGAVRIFQKHVNPKDTCSVIVFNNESHIVLPPTLVEGNEDLIRSRLYSLRNPGGMTAVYDALGDALELAIGIRGSVQRWIILLTDGEDNSSRRYTYRHRQAGRKSIPKLIERYKRGLNLVIMDVSDGYNETSHVLNNIAQVPLRGHYVLVRRKTNVAKAIDEAFARAEQVLAEVEVESFAAEEV